jgi:hypothetical protein
MPPKKKKKLQQPAIIRTLAKSSSEKFWYHFSEQGELGVFIGVFEWYFKETFCNICI